eukprot:GHVN01079546.1.p1 GENE.GHVN01079546.1~~GHVN01079546.1.p1  ORF type:complete len:138 (+),score=38.01 GHVN01079546.1:462-875(+)
MPMKLDDDWNQIQFNLADFCRRAYGTNYVETLRVCVHANCRLRRIFFTDHLTSLDQLPTEFKLYLPRNCIKEGDEEEVCEIYTDDDEEGRLKVMISPTTPYSPYSPYSPFSPYSPDSPNSPFSPLSPHSPYSPFSQY